MTAVKTIQGRTTLIFDDGDALCTDHTPICSFWRRVYSAFGHLSAAVLSVVSLLLAQFWSDGEIRGDTSHAGAYGHMQLELHRSLQQFANRPLCNQTDLLKALAMSSAHNLTVGLRGYLA